MRTDELALREALADMTVGQPDLPVDRVAGVRRKHAHRRQLQAVAGACAVAVIAVAAVAVGGTFNGARRVEPLDRSVPSWALQWADHRDGSVPQAVLTNAVNSWASKQRADAPLPKSQPIQMSPAVWYVGEQVPGTDRVLAVFEASGLHAGALPLTTGPRLVVAQANWDDVKNVSATDDGAWTFTDIAAPTRGYPGFIGSYIPVSDATGVHNVVWLLTSPSYPHAQFSTGGQTLKDGFVTFDAGQLQIREEVSVQAANGRYPAGGYLGIPGVPSSQVPTLALAGELTGYPQSQLTLGESAGQGSSTYLDEDAKAPAGRATTVYARCYTAGDTRSIRVVVDGDVERGRVRGVRISCDGRQHVVPGNATAINAFDHGHSVSVRAPALIAWTVAVVISPR